MTSIEHRVAGLVRTGATNRQVASGIQNSVNSFGIIFFPNTMFGPYLGSEGQAVYNAAQSA